MSDYTAMDDGELYHELGGGGYKWAQAFRQYHPNCNVDDGMLLAWFSNACMGGHDAALGDECGNIDRIDTLTAEIARKDEALRSIAEWSDTALGFESCARDMRRTARAALGTIDDDRERRE